MINEILSHFECVKKESENRYSARCPAHNDKNPSLSIYINKDWVYLKCYAGCTQDEILKAVGLNSKDLYVGEKKPKKQLVNSILYDYVDENGVVLYQRKRNEYNDGTKKFYCIQPDGTYGMKGLKHTIYNLPEVIKTKMVYFVEGEKCADILIKQGLVATTLDGGANSKMKDEWIEYFKDKTVIILPDNDEPGRKYARNIKHKIPWAVIKELPDLEKKEDVYDWLHKGHSVAEIDSLPETEYEIEPESISTEKKAPAKLMLEILEQLGVKTFLNENNIPYVEFPIKDYTEVHKLDSSDFKCWTANIYIEFTDKTIKKEALNEALNIMDARTRFSGNPAQTVHIRVAECDGDFWYDLSNANRTAVKVTPDGWSIETPVPKFYRYSHQSPQITPVDGGRIEDIFQLINLKKYRTLFLCWLVSCFVPDIPHPMPIIYGEKGAAKSTSCILLKKLIDPSALETLSLSKDERSLIVSLQKHYYLPFDNVSVISNDISDTLCRAITGGAIQQRKLYTNDDDCIFTFMRCITINGINNVANRSDLLDRSLLFELSRVSEENRVEAQRVYNEFEIMRPKVLGAIFKILSAAMKVFPTVQLDKLPRMADFCRWGYAIGEALGNKGDVFLSEYHDNQSIQNQEAINADSVAYLVVNFMAFKRTWTGLFSDLFKQLKELAENLGMNTTSKVLPQAPNHLSRRIKAVKSNLEDVGITFEIETKSNGSYITINNDNLSKLSPDYINPYDILNLDTGDTGDKGDKSTIDDNDDTNIEF